MMKNEKLIEEVRLLVKEVEKTHRYSMSKIYGAYNKVFNTSEIPASCASCLIRKVKALKEWLKTQDAIVVTSAEQDSEENKDSIDTVEPKVKKRKSRKKSKLKEADEQA